MPKISQELQLLESLSKALWPLNRSITGPGLEASLALFQKHMDLSIEKINTGEHVFDWTVPQEWHLKRAYLKTPDGDIICDTSVNNLHLVNYSQPLQAEMTLDELQSHLHSIPELPDAIPYVTSYYQKNWGFCLSHNQRESLKPGQYEVVIDSEFKDGGVPFAQAIIKGESEQEILLSSYLCHPSMANNELSGPLTLLLLYQRISAWPKKRYTYRFLLNPETIGTLCFLHKYHEHLNSKLLSGMILTCVGGPEPSLRYKQTYSANSLFDNIFLAVNDNQISIGEPVAIQPFTPVYGSDERQYAAPGFRLPVGQLSRTTYGTYPGYHNSLDTLEFMNLESLIKSANSLEKILYYAEYCGKPVNLAPYGEPQLGKRGLYPNLNSRIHTAMSSDEVADSRKTLNRLLIVLNMADGETDLFKIAENCQCSVDELIPIINLLEEHDLIAFGAQT